MQEVPVLEMSGPLDGFPLWGTGVRSEDPRHRHWVTFADGRAPSSTDESLGHDARVDDALQLPPPMWLTEEVPQGGADCSMDLPRHETETIPAEGEDKLENLLPLEPHLGQLLGEKEPSPAGDNLSEDPEPSPMCHLDCIAWDTRCILMLSWWKELVEVPGQEDYQLFTRMVHTSFEVPKACSQAQGLNNHHMPPCSHPSIGKDRFLPPQTEQFHAQDYWLTQPQHMVTYARVLQHWAEKAQPPNPSEPHHLVGSVAELWWVMEPLVTFTDDEVFAAMAPSDWAEITLPQLAEPVSPGPHCQHTYSQSHSCQACPRGSLVATHSKSQPTITMKTEASSLPRRWCCCHLVRLHQGTRPHTPTRVHGNHPWPMKGELVEGDQLSAIVGIPPKDATDSYEVVGSSIMVMHLFGDPRSGERFIDMLTCTMSVVDQNLDFVVEDHPALALQEMSDSN